MRHPLALLAVFLALPLRAQDTPQPHRTADITLTNGSIEVYSVDSGGARRVVVNAGALTLDSLIGFPRGGQWTATVAEVESVVPILLAGLDALRAGKRVLDEIPFSYPSGPVRSAVIRCLATGCTVTVVNRTTTGATRTGSWTSSRLPLTAVQGLVVALRTAARHDSDFVFVYP